jgi:hypothetical protein
MAENFSTQEFSYISSLASNDGSDDISPQDLAKALDQGLINFETGVVTPTEVGRIMAEHDKNGDGYLQHGGRMAENFSTQEFSYISSLASNDGSDDISPQDLAKALDQGLITFETGVVTPTEVGRIMAEHDKNGDVSTERIVEIATTTTDSAVLHVLVEVGHHENPVVAHAIASNDAASKYTLDVLDVAHPHDVNDPDSLYLSALLLNSPHGQHYGHRQLSAPQNGYYEDQHVEQIERLVGVGLQIGHSVEEITNTVAASFGRPVTPLLEAHVALAVGDSEFSDETALADAITLLLDHGEADLSAEEAARVGVVRSEAALSLAENVNTSYADRDRLLDSSEFHGHSVQETVAYGLSEQPPLSLEAMATHVVRDLNIPLPLAQAYVAGTVGNQIDATPEQLKEATQMLLGIDPTSLHTTQEGENVESAQIIAANIISANPEVSWEILGDLSTNTNIASDPVFASTVAMWSLAVTDLEKPGYRQAMDNIHAANNDIVLDDEDNILMLDDQGYVDTMLRKDGTITVRTSGEGENSQYETFEAGDLNQDEILGTSHHHDRDLLVGSGTLLRTAFQGGIRNGVSWVGSQVVKSGARVAATEVTSVTLGAEAVGALLVSGAVVGGVALVAAAAYFGGRYLVNQYNEQHNIGVFVDPLPTNTTPIENPADFDPDLTEVAAAQQTARNIQADLNGESPLSQDEIINKYFQPGTPKSDIGEVLNELVIAGEDEPQLLADISEVFKKQVDTGQWTASELQEIFGSMDPKRSLVLIKPWQDKIRDDVFKQEDAQLLEDIYGAWYDSIPKNEQGRLYDSERELVKSIMRTSPHDGAVLLSAMSDSDGVSALRELAAEAGGEEIVAGILDVLWRRSPFKSAALEDGLARPIDPALLPEDVPPSQNLANSAPTWSALYYADTWLTESGDAFVVVDEIPDLPDFQRISPNQLLNNPASWRAQRSVYYEAIRRAAQVVQGDTFESRAEFHERLGDWHGHVRDIVLDSTENAQLAELFVRTLSTVQGSLGVQWDHYPGLYSSGHGQFGRLYNSVAPALGMDYLTHIGIPNLFDGGPYGMAGANTDYIVSSTGAGARHHYVDMMAGGYPMGPDGNPLLDRNVRDIMGEDVWSRGGEAAWAFLWGAAEQREAMRRTYVYIQSLDRVISTDHYFDANYVNRVLDDIDGYLGRWDDAHMAHAEMMSATFHQGGNYTPREESNLHFWEGEGISETASGMLRAMRTGVFSAVPPNMRDGVRRVFEYLRYIDAWGSH